MTKSDYIAPQPTIGQSPAVEAAQQTATEPERRRIPSPLSLLARRLRASGEAKTEDAQMQSPAPAEIAPPVTQDAIPLPTIEAFDEPATDVLPAADIVPMFAEEPPPPAVEQTAKRGARVKTTFLGFEHSDGRIDDFFAKEQKAASQQRSLFPVGWVVVIAGPGRGQSIPLSAGVSQIGRGDDQAVQLDFGDNAISRVNHAAIAYDDEDQKFYLGHGGKTNIVRLNGRPVLSTESLMSGDRIRIGETTLMFVACCGTNFQWSAPID